MELKHIDIANLSVSAANTAPPDSPNAKSEEIMTDKPDTATMKRLERAVGKLPRLQREIFLAARLDDMSYVEIAERTGLSVRQVERAIARALVSIARRMDRQSRRWWRR
jgi:RNA polymerase sigma factor (sigma-70 family)